MMKKIGYGIVCLFCPAIVFFVYNEWGRSFLLLMLQASLLGWPFATWLAWKKLKSYQ